MAVDPNTFKLRPPETIRREIFEHHQLADKSANNRPAPGSDRKIGGQGAMKQRKAIISPLDNH